MVEASLSSSGTMEEGEMITLKETLRAQQQLLQMLYTELDEEREASATAASEALDMIHRLQGEKAAAKMEARQYERMTEERLEHGETTLEIYEELLFQKDMEIGNLENQVDAYKKKLASLGCDPNLTEFELLENHININSNSTTNNNSNDYSSINTSDDESVRRLQSLPPLPVNKNKFKAARKRDRSPSPQLLLHHHHHIDVMQTIEEKKTEQKPVVQPGESSHETLDSYWEQIKNLDEKVKEISDCKETEGECKETEGIKGQNLRGRRHRSLHSTRSKSISSSISPKRHVHHHEFSQHQNRELITDPSCSVNVHDVFEVPQPEILGTTHSDNRLTKPDPEVLSRYDSGKILRLLSMNMESKEHSPTGVHSNNNNNKKRVTCMFGRKMEGSNTEYCNGEAEFHVLSKRIERLEKENEMVERVSSRLEITHEEDSGEQLRLLKEILSQLKSMREETIFITSREKNSPSKDDDNRLLDRLKEGMLHCWI